jgi:ribA/ribD-fused uncharacterized protein
MITPVVTLPAITSFRNEYEFLSNFSRAAGLIPVEYLYQARKALLQEQARWVMGAATPGEAKRRGRRVQILPGWDSQRRAVMLDLELEKFSAPLLRDRLAATRGRALIEGNSWGDTFWGAEPLSGFVPALPVWHDGAGNEFYGHNWLGRILMMVRDVMDPLS